METASPHHLLPYRLAAIDLDGTLLGPNKEIGPENLAAVRRLQDAGVQIIVASGRRHQNSIRFQRQLGLHGPIIACQGGLIRDGDTGEVVEAHLLAPEAAAEVVVLGEVQGVDVIYYHLDHLFVGPIYNEFLRLYESRVGERAEVVGDLKALGGRDALKIVWYGPPELLRALRAELTERFAGRADVLSTEQENLEFMPLGVSKASALAKVASVLGIEAGEVMTFGDGENDVPMLGWAGLGVAMAHGNAVAKAAAKLVSPPGPADADFARAVDAIFARYAGGSPASEAR
ncbi:MAG: HAD family phosphatase [Verrucomicrobia bacterium]|nr:HAD family phosphatase [Verrucomicrobiota bacterium]